MTDIKIQEQKSNTHLKIIVLDELFEVLLKIALQIPFLEVLMDCSSTEHNETIVINEVSPKFFRILINFIKNKEKILHFENEINIFERDDVIRWLKYLGMDLLIKKLYGDKLTYYSVWLRSMTTYMDHSHKLLQYENELNIVRQISQDFDEYDKALEWLLKNGKNITKIFQREYDQPCAIIILNRIYDFTYENFYENFYKYNIPDLYWLEPRLSFVFTEKAYYMTLREHYIFHSHDWDLPYPKWNFYIRNKQSTILNFIDEYDNIGFDNKYIEHGLRSDEDFSLDKELDDSDENNLEIICGCDNLYFEKQLKNYDVSTKENFKNEFNNYKNNRLVLSKVFDNYNADKTNINDFSEQLKILIKI